MKIVLKPLKGPMVNEKNGFVINFDVNSRYIISRMRNWKDAAKIYEIGDFDGVPCLYIRDEYLSCPHAELVYVSGRIGIREASDNVKNHIYVNVKIPTQDNYVKEAVLNIGDIITLGRSILRVESQSPEQRIINQVYPELNYVSSLNQSGNVHLCRSQQGQEIIVEYYKFTNLSADLKKELIEFRTQFEDLKKRAEVDEELKRIIPRLLNIELMEAGQDGYLFLVREKIYAPTLYDILVKENHIFKTSEALELGLMILEGLNKIQKVTKKRYQNLVPSSIHFDRRSLTPHIIFNKIMDINFFLSKSDPLASGEFTSDRLYWAPEYIEFGTFNERSQIYGISLLILTAMLGELPIKAYDHVEFREALKQEKIIFPDDLPKHVVSILRRACSPNKGHRFQNMAEFKLSITMSLKQIIAQDATG